MFWFHIRFHMLLWFTLLLSKCYSNKGNSIINTPRFIAFAFSFCLASSVLKPLPKLCVSSFCLFFDMYIIIYFISELSKKFKVTDHKKKLKLKTIPTTTMNKCITTFKKLVRGVVSLMTSWKPTTKKALKNYSLEYELYSHILRVSH